MLFEDAIKAMREGKRCTFEETYLEYYMSNGKIFCHYDTGPGETCNSLNQMVDKNWHIIKPPLPLPLPRRFRAKYRHDNSACVGSVFSDGYTYWKDSDGCPGACHDKDRDRYLKEIEYIDRYLKEIEYIDANS
jgi:hypothetical protein